MNDQELADKTLDITETMRFSEIRDTIDNTGLVAPKVFRGGGPGKVKLIFLGQDPTVKDPENRKAVKVVLNLDQKKKGLYTYLKGICDDLGLDIEQNVYATNLLKNFFIDPPDVMEKDGRAPGLIKRAFPYWKDLLSEELYEFKNTPVITLGEPVISCIMNKAVLIRDFWGYQGRDKFKGKMKHILPDQNLLHWRIFPFPHIHGLRHDIYSEKSRKKYAKYMKEYIR